MIYFTSHRTYTIEQLMVDPTVDEARVFFSAPDDMSISAVRVAIKMHLSHNSGVKFISAKAFNAAVKGRSYTVHAL